MSTLSIPGAMKAYSGSGRDAASEEAGVALVGVHSEYPRFGEERALGGGTYKGGAAAKHKPNIGYRYVQFDTFLHCTTSVSSCCH